MEIKRWCPPTSRHVSVSVTSRVSQRHVPLDTSDPLLKTDVVFLSFGCRGTGSLKSTMDVINAAKVN